MSLVATMTFDDEDPDLHTHMSAYARALADEQPVEFARVLRTLEESLDGYRARVKAYRDKLELTLTTERERQEATDGQRQG